jgi:peptide chain release factor 3
VREFLAGVGELAPPPRPQPADPRPILPEEPRVAGFVFKVQANIDPHHRDRIAFVRIASGRFQRGMKLKNIRTGRLMAVHPPVFRQISGWEFPILHPSAINLSGLNLRPPASRMP